MNLTSVTTMLAGTSLRYFIGFCALISLSVSADPACPLPEPPATPAMSAMRTQSDVDAYVFSYRQFKVRMSLHQQCLIQMRQQAPRRDSAQQQAAMTQAHQEQQAHTRLVQQQVVQADNDYRTFLDQLHRSGKGFSVSPPKAPVSANSSPNSPDPALNPCRGKPKFFRRQPGNPARLIYSGDENIRRLPSVPIALGSEIPAAVPACVKMRFTVVGEGAGRSLSELVFLGITGGIASDAPYVKAATAAIDIAVKEDLFAEIAKEGWDYEVNIPVWAQHSLFSGQPSQVATGDLAELGYYDAKKVSAEDGLRLYRVESRHKPADVFVAIKKFQPDEPIGKTPIDLLNWFRQYVAPHVQGDPQASDATATVFFYDQDVVFPAKEQATTPHAFYPPATMDPAVHQPVARALKSFRFQGRRVEMNTAFEWWIPPTNELPDPYQTLAAIQQHAAELAQISQKQQDYFSQRHASGEFQRELASKKAAFQAKLDADNASAMKAGTIFRPHSYWLSYRSYPELEWLFHGRTERKEALLHSLVFLQFYIRFQAHFAAYCPDLVPKDSPTIAYKTITQLNDLSAPIISYSAGVPIRRAYWDKFNQFFAETGQAISAQAMGELGSGGSGSSTGLAQAQLIMGLNRDLARIFKENSCESGFMQQLSENMRRIAYGEPTVQADRAMTFQYQQHDTSKHLVKPTLAGACYDATLGDIDSRTIPLCQCFEERFSTLLSEQEMAAAIADYPAFERKINTTPDTPRDPLWRYVNEANRCKR